MIKIRNTASETSLITYLAFTLLSSLLAAIYVGWYSISAWLLAALLLVSIFYNWRIPGGAAANVRFRCRHRSTR